MPRLRCNGLEIEYESLGDPAAPAILLIMGLGMQLLAWPDDFCQRLLARGFRVIRFDNRDVGLSARYGGDEARQTWCGRCSRQGCDCRCVRPIRLSDMADDAIGLLDGLGIAQAHVVGASMGGMIAQLLAARFPQRVLSLTSIMSSSGNRRLEPPKPDALKALLSRPADPHDVEAVIDHLVRVFGIIGSPGFPPDPVELRQRLSRSVRRGYYPQGVARQLIAVIASGDRRKLLRTIVAPTLVIHGAADPLVPPEAGRDTARNIPGAKLMLIEGMGHDLPPALYERLAEAIAAHCVSHQA